MGSNKPNQPEKRTACVGPRQRRRWWPVALVVGVFFLFGSGSGWLVWRARQAGRQRKAVERVRALGGFVYYDYQYEKGQGEERLVDAEPRPAPEWLYALVGPDFLHDVFYVSFALFRRGDRESRQPIRIDAVTDAELETLRAFPELRWLSLVGTRVTDAGMRKLAGFARLERLWLSSTRVGDRGLGYLSNMTTLRHLFLNDTQVTDAGLAYLARLTQLQRLWLTGPQITDAGLARLRSLRHLELLFLDGTSQTDAGMEHLGTLDRLEMLRVSYCRRIGDAGLEPVGRLRRLRELDLSYCPKLTDAGMWHLRDLPAVRALSLRGTQLTDAGLVHLAAMKQLETLHLEETACTLSGVVHLFERLQGRTAAEALAAVGRPVRDEQGRIVALDLTGIRVTDRGLAYLKACPHLQWLYLQDAAVTDEGLKQLAPLKRLTLLQLSHTRITDAGLRHLRRLRQLRTLHVAGTGVTEQGAQQLAEAYGNRLRVYLTDFAQYGAVALPGASVRAGGGPSPPLHGVQPPNRLIPEDWEAGGDD